VDTIILTCYKAVYIKHAVDISSLNELMGTYYYLLVYLSIFEVVKKCAYRTDVLDISEYRVTTL
jgi:hypothetical protein